MQIKPTAEQSYTDMNAAKNHTNNSQLVSREEIDGTPFHIIGNEDVGYFLAFGRYKLTENQPTKETVLLLVEAEKWNILANMIALMLDIDRQEQQTVKMAILNAEKEVKNT